ncbi:MAG TPA: ABC transporter ATP-binding protein [Symbiobacteriaceae bacterium]
MIEVTEVTRLYGRKVGVRDLTFRVEAGEVLGLLGPNGAGKSTTLRMLTGYLAPTAGTIRIAGRDLWQRPEESRALIGSLPDRPPLYREMTVRQYLTFAAALRGVPARLRRDRVEAVLRQLGLQGVAGRLVGNLSRGYQQRVSLAQAIVHDPPVLVLDEPTVGLDPVQIAEVRDLIRELGRNRTVILSSHILPEVEQLCTRVLVMDRGRVIAEDTPQGLAARLQPSRRYRLEAAGDPESVRALVSAIPGVLRVQAEGRLLLVETTPETDVRPALFFRLAEARMPILQLTPVAMSLEDVFLRLITQETAAGEATG